MRSNIGQKRFTKVGEVPIESVFHGEHVFGVGFVLRKTETAQKAGLLGSRPRGSNETYHT